MVKLWYHYTWWKFTTFEFAICFIYGVYYFLLSLTQLVEGKIDGVIRVFYTFIDLVCGFNGDKYSMSSLSIHEARSDIFLKKISFSSSLASFSATASVGASNSRIRCWIVLSSILSKSSKVGSGYFSSGYSALAVFFWQQACLRQQAKDGSQNGK